MSGLTSPGIAQLVLATQILYPGPNQCDIQEDKGRDDSGEAKNHQGYVPIEYEVDCLPNLFEHNKK